jgi:hypothetical protein
MATPSIRSGPFGHGSKAKEPSHGYLEIAFFIILENRLFEFTFLNFT